MWRKALRTQLFKLGEEPVERGSLEILKLNRIIHDPARLLILTFLYPVAKLDYLSLRRAIKFTTGNLSRQLQILEKAGYVAIEFQGEVSGDDLRDDEERARSSCAVCGNAEAGYESDGGREGKLAERY